MLENCRNARERWGGVSELIDRWLKERQELLVHYCELSALTDYSQTDMLREKFIRLFEVLVDYVSTGHFEIYEQLTNEAKEFDDGGVELARELVPKLDKLTGQCVDFNDTYDQNCAFELLAKLPQDLSNIGEILEERFELEDQLIEQLHNVHKDQVAEEA